MYQLCKKLQFVKAVLKRQNLDCFGDLKLRILQARDWLDLAQKDVMFSRGSADCLLKEKGCLHAYVSITKAEEAFLKQNARNQWFQLGDQNNAVFHRLLTAVVVAAAVGTRAEAGPALDQDMPPWATQLYNRLDQLGTRIGEVHDQVGTLNTTLGKHVTNFEEEQGRWETDQNTLSLLTTTINRIREKLKVEADEELHDFFDGPVGGDV